MYKGPVEAHSPAPVTVGVLVQHGDCVIDLSQRLAPIAKEQETVGKEGAAAYQIGETQIGAFLYCLELDSTPFVQAAAGLAVFGADPTDEARVGQVRGEYAPIVGAENLRECMAEPLGV